MRTKGHPPVCKNSPTCTDEAGLAETGKDNLMYAKIGEKFVSNHDPEKVVLVQNVVVSRNGSGDIEGNVDCLNISSGHGEEYNIDLEDFLNDYRPLK